MGTVIGDSANVAFEAYRLAKQIRTKRIQLAGNALVPVLTVAVLLVNHWYKLDLGDDVIGSVSVVLVWLFNHWATTTSTDRIDGLGRRTDDGAMVGMDSPAAAATAAGAAAPAAADMDRTGAATVPADVARAGAPGGPPGINDSRFDTSGSS